MLYMCMAWSTILDYDTGELHDLLFANSKLDWKQSLHKSVEWPAFLRQSCFVAQTNKMTKGGLKREV